MQEFLVLGLVPGTNIQITFGGWLIVMCMIIGVLLFSLAHRRQVVSAILVTLLIMQQTRQVRA